MAFTKATRKQAKLRLGLMGPSGSGKTWTALSIATGLLKPGDGRIAVIDSERGSASLYANDFDFDQKSLERFSPREYIDAIRMAEKAGYSAIIIDSLTHAWSGIGGVLEIVDNVAAKSNGNKFAGWREGSPEHNHLVDAMLQSRCHVIATLRVNTEWILEKDEKTGKNVPKKIGLKPQQRDGMEYEFTAVAQLDEEHNATITKTRISYLDGRLWRKPDQEFGAKMLEWLDSGEPDASPPKSNETIEEVKEDAKRFAAELGTEKATLVRRGRPMTTLAQCIEVRDELFVAVEQRRKATEILQAELDKRDGKEVAK